MIYEGEWVNGQVEGQGKATWPGEEAMSIEGTCVDSEIVNGKEILSGVKITVYGISDGLYTYETTDNTTTTPYMTMFYYE